jgi:predicted RNA-binding Zn-ribbon protein involved in translation (DUF1610 family)
MYNTIFNCEDCENEFEKEHPEKTPPSDISCNKCGKKATAFLTYCLTCDLSLQLIDEDRVGEQCSQCGNPKEAENMTNEEIAEAYEKTGKFLSAEATSKLVWTYRCPKCKHENRLEEQGCYEESGRMWGEVYEKIYKLVCPSCNQALIIYESK